MIFASISFTSLKDWDPLLTQRGHARGAVETHIPVARQDEFRGRAHNTEFAIELPEPRSAREARSVYGGALALWRSLQPFKPLRILRGVEEFYAHGHDYVANVWDTFAYPFIGFRLLLLP